MTNTGTAALPRSRAARSRAIEAAFTDAGLAPLMTQMGHGDLWLVRKCDPDAAVAALLSIPWAVAELGKNGNVFVTITQD